MKRTVGIAAFVGLLLATFVRCDRSAPKQQGALQRTSLTTSKNSWCTLALVANEKGFFAEEGLDVNPEYQAAGRYCLDAVISKSSDFGTIVEVNVAYHGFTGNDNLVVVGTVARSTSSAIVARKSAGIEKPSDLKGKRLGLSPGTTSDMFAHRFLAAHHLAVADVDIRKIQPTALQDGMVTKSIDSASSWDPFVYNIQRALGDDAVTFTAPEDYRGYENIAVRRDWAKNHPAEVRAFLRALKRAEYIVKSDAALAQQLVSKAINLDLAIVKANWGFFDFRLVLNKEELVNAIRSEGEEIRTREEAFIGKPLPDYSIFIDDSFIKGLE